MELKFGEIFTYDNFTASFELNLYGIEILLVIIKAENLGRLNWTFMELKYIVCTSVSFSPLVWIEPLWNWNSHSDKVSKGICIVWIEPLWNWNMLAASQAALMLGLNWTFMELKLVLCSAEGALVMGLNWTFMELKLQQENGMQMGTYGLNWTFMELKFRQQNVEGIRSNGLNWTFMELKSAIGNFMHAQKLFELNLYGIEINIKVSAENLAYMFELNLYGIEIGDTNGIEDGQSVWIEPLWNWNRLSDEVLKTMQEFELNLYGIEIPWLLSPLAREMRLNWTFMELKFWLT